MRRRAFVQAVLLVPLVLMCAWSVRACGDEATPSRAETTAAKARAPVATVGELHAPDAFEIVATSEGAVLVWSAPGACERALRAQRFSAAGVALGDPVVVANACDAAPELARESTRVRELAAVAAAGRIGVSWIAEDETHAIALGTFGDDEASAFAPARRLRDVERAYDRPRTRLAMATSDDAHMRIALRTEVGPCVAQHGQCTHIVSLSHPGTEAAAERGTDTREVERPCPGLLSGALWANGVWYDAFCVLDAADARPVTQVFAVRPETYYAEVVPALPGCTPLGLAPGTKGAWLFAECGDGLSAQQLVPEARPAELRAATRSVRCEDGRPTFVLGQAASLPLQDARDRIELFVPPALAPLGSRAVFTGQRVLVAYPQAGVLKLATLVCQGHALVPDIGSML
jgi:hypothetical protein